MWMQFHGQNGGALVTSGWHARVVEARECDDPMGASCLCFCCGAWVWVVVSFTSRRFVVPV